ncbi:hypothetical protein [Paenarthrobacter aromaticivorans]|uniref:hypothetical protein n=1 Tax=Paenarthrobacter aromaticivorans TaxID=2849150 RepID=UPI003A80BD7F
MSAEKPIVSPNAKQKRVVFGVLIVAAYVMALMPPIYIAFSAVHDVVAGLPVSVWYMFGVCIFAVLTCCALYIYESVRKELD